MVSLTSVQYDALLLLVVSKGDIVCSMQLNHQSKNEHFNGNINRFESSRFLQKKQHFFGVVIPAQSFHLPDIA